MTLDMNLFWIIIGAAIVTWIPRITPFIFVRKVALPDVVMRFLKYVPISILSALVFSNLFVQTEQGVGVDWSIFFALIPTVLIAIWTKSLSLTVIIGVISMGLIRLFI